MEHSAPLSSVDGGAQSSQDAAELGRYRDALWRNWLLILVIVVPMTAIVFAVSRELPPTYRSTATIVLDEEGVGRVGANPELVGRALETAERLITTRQVLRAAATRLRGESVDTLAEKVSASASAEANLVRVTAEDDNAVQAARIANAVVTAFLAENTSRERRALAAIRSNLLRRIARLQGTGRTGEIAALRARMHEVSVTEANVGTGITRADRARPAERPDSPRLLQNTLFALFGFIFLAVLVALAREQLSPRVRDPRELAGLLGAPLLLEVPVRRRWASGRDRTLPAAYELLQESVQSLLPPGEVQSVLVASLYRERASTDIAAGVADAFARRGQRTLLVGELPGEAGTAQAPPASELVRNHDSQRLQDLLARAEIRPELLAFSYAGDAPPRSREQIETLTEGLSAFGVRYVVMLGRSLFGSQDGLLLPRLMDGVLLVCRPERITRDAAGRLGQLLRASGANVLGVVSIGGRRVVPYELRAMPARRRSAASPSRRDRSRRDVARARRPNQSRNEPEMTPVESVHEETVHEEPAPSAK
jgi:capsular polysaccharide biosynthesis protein